MRTYTLWIRFVALVLAAALLGGFTGCGGGGDTLPLSPVINNFTFTRDPGSLTVTFTVTADVREPGATITGYTWDFDNDGTTDQSTTANSVTNTYTLAAVYTAKVTVTDSEGSSAESTREVDLRGVTTLDAQLTVTPSSGEAPLDVSVNGGTSTGNITNYEFDFGEGTGYEDYDMTSSTTHTYNTAGSYTVQLRVTGSDSSTDTDNATVTVTAAALPGSDPVIDDATYTEGTRTLTVTVSDPDDGETLTVSVTEPNGLEVTDGVTSKDASATGPLTAEFVWKATSVPAGGSGDTTITVEDSNGRTASTTATITVQGSALALSLTNPPGPDKGAGEEEDPYAGNVSAEYVFHLTDPLHGNVSVHPDTVWEVHDTLTDEVTADPGAIDTTSGFAVLDIVDTYTGQFYVTAAYDGNPSTPAAIYFIVDIFVEPVAVIWADIGRVDDPAPWPPPEGDAPLTVTFDASESYDPAPDGGSIIQYRWDWESDGTVDSTKNDPTDSHTFPLPAAEAGVTQNVYTVTLTVIDDEPYPFTGRNSVTIDVIVHGWRPVEVNVNSAADHDVGKFTSLMLVDGNPAIAYYDAENGDLMYSRANVLAPVVGSEWDAGIRVQTEGDVGQFSTMALVQDNPAIAYYDADNHNLLYIRAEDNQGATWGITPVPLHTTIPAGRYASMTIINNRPAVSYIADVDDPVDGFYELMYVRASDEFGNPDWQQPVRVSKIAPLDTIDFEWTSLCEVDGTPAIASRDNTNDQLLFIRSTDVNGVDNSWDEVAVIDDEPGAGREVKLGLVDGDPVDGSGYLIPAVIYSIYHDPNYSTVWWAYADNESGETSTLPAFGNWTQDPVYLGDGRWPSFLVIDGMPIMDGYPECCFYSFDHPDYTEGQLRGRSSLTNWGGPMPPTIVDPWIPAWPDIDYIDQELDSGQYTSMTNIEILDYFDDPVERPAVAYYDESDGDLMFAIYY